MNEQIFYERVGVTFSNYYRKNYTKLVRFLTTFGKADHNLAEDCATESFIVSLDKIESYDPSKAQFSTWLFTIGKRIIIQRLKEQSRFSSIEAPNQDGFCIGDTLFDEIEDREYEFKLAHHKAQIIKELIPELPKKYREVLDLREIRGYSYDEISEVLGINLNTIKSRIRQGRRLVVKKTRDKFELLDNLDELQLNSKTSWV